MVECEFHLVHALLEFWQHLNVHHKCQDKASVPYSQTEDGSVAPIPNWINHLSAHQKACETYLESEHKYCFGQQLVQLLLQSESGDFHLIMVFFLLGLQRVFLFLLAEQSQIWLVFICYFHVIVDVLVVHGADKKHRVDVFR